MQLTPAPGEQSGARCLAQGSHLSHGQFLPEPRFKPTTSGYKSDALSIRARQSWHSRGKICILLCNIVGKVKVCIKSRMSKFMVEDLLSIILLLRLPYTIVRDK